ncbi:MAG: bifunctional chorismate mutase/prephenate dehydratase [Erysipelotrichaceae bacterium]|nr:bifunctional chorismate mutase/prephenate dehydratase [Erysipelotrichaceae bacterium]
MNTLEEARLIINETDEKIAELFERRMEAVRQVALYKKEHNLPIFDPSREDYLLNKNLKYLHNEELTEYYRDFQKHTMEVSKKYQASLVSQKKIGYQGIIGAFSHIAALSLYPYDNLISYPSFETIFEAVQNDLLDYGLIPFENSLTGDVADVMDLCRRYDMHISCIYHLKINQNLLVKPGTRLEDIRQVYSHPQALSQCALFLKNRPWDLVSYANTALAAKFVSEQDHNSYAAIASEETARIYNLEILAGQINSNTTNTTRFIVISKKEMKPATHFNVQFTVNHTAGALAKVIDAIRDAHCNMECIKSFPQKDVPWAYYFYIELEGNLFEEKNQQLIESMKAHCLEFKVMGSYEKK